MTGDNTIIAFSNQGKGFQCGSGCIPTLTNCNIYGNAGGDALCEDGVGRRQDPRRYGRIEGEELSGNLCHSHSGHTLPPGICRP